jgi:hypothetical protein
MRIEFTPESASGVRVLPLIENHPIARLEGRNGLGKTMAIRLLQLCTGRQPYGPGDRGIWIQLKQSLAPVKIICTELNGAEKVEWEIDPTHWPDEPETPPTLIAENGTPGICRSVKVNGKRSGAEEVLALFRIDRLVGNETLIESITGEVVAQHERAAEERAIVDERTMEVRTFLDALRDLLAKAASATVEEAHEEFRVSRSTLEKARTEIGGAETRRDQLKELLLRKRQLGALLEEHDDPEGYLQELDDRLSKLRDDLVATRAKQASLDLNAEVEAQALEQIEELERKISEHEQARDDALKEARELCLRLQLPEIPSGAGEPAFKEPEGEALERLNELRSLQAMIDAGPQVQELGEKVLGLLDNDLARTIKDQPIATLATDRKISPDELSAGIRLRQEEITEEARVPQHDRLVEAISQAADAVRDFKSLGTALRRKNRRNTELGKTRKRLTELAEGLTGTKGEQFAELESKSQQLAQSEADIEAERTHLLQQMGQVASGISTSTLKQRLARDLEEAESSEGAIEQDLEHQATLVRGLADRQHELALGVESAEAGYRAAKAEQEEALAQMAGLDRWKMLREAQLLPLPTLGEDENQARALRLQSRCDDLEEALDDVSSLVADQILAGLAAAVACDEPAAEPVRKVVRQLESSLGERYFGDPTVAEALFDGGRLIRFDLLRRVVEWQPDDAELVTRHLDAFSSGERAFAYTKARLERLRDEPTAQNRFAALDEFGAFLERSRLELLEQYLAEDVVGKFVDQSLIILPLTRPRDAIEQSFVTTPYER